MVVMDGVLFSLLDHVFGSDPERTLLCPGGKQAFDRRFASLARALCVDQWFSPGCLRGGGAIHFFQKTGSLDQLQLRGRWECQRTLLHYLQEGLATTAWGDVAVERRERIYNLARCAPLLLEAAKDLSDERV